jgi:hypothetical protein
VSIDWDKNVIGPLMKVFGESFTFTPLVSQPAAAPYAITGVFDEAYIGVALAGGTEVTTESPVLGVQLSQFAVQPKQADEALCQRTGESFVEKEVRIDGHGSAKLLLNYS